MTPSHLKEHRRALGLTQAELAGLLGVQANTIARWERGEKAIGQPTMLGLALVELGRRQSPEMTKARR